MRKIKLILSIIIIVIVVFALLKGTTFLGEVFSLSEYEGESIAITVNMGDTASSVAQKLEDMGIIKSKNAFIIRYKLFHRKTPVYFGDHIIDNGMDTDDMIKVFTTMPKNTGTLMLTIPEGYTVERIAEKLEGMGICTYDEFVDEIKNGKFDYEFIKHIPKADYKYRLEGFLFPNTYEIYANDSAHNIIDKMLGEFEKNYKENFSTYDNIFEIVTMASIVEREAVIDSERAKIAGVIKNRIEKGMLLQIDATVVYAKSSGRYDMTQVTYKDLEVDSPYNTYKNKGLPPGPICSSGIKSIIASAKPEKHQWLFYHTDEVKKDGSHIFTKTFDEHIATMN